MDMFSYVYRKNIFICKECGTEFSSSKYRKKYQRKPKVYLESLGNNQNICNVCLGIQAAINKFDGDLEKIKKLNLKGIL